jgi:hypothetical protein
MMKFVVLPVLAAADVKWASFDGAAESTASWIVKNDPVMGGGSVSNFTKTDEQTGLFQGRCNIISFLGAPGFASVVGYRSFADASGFESIQLKVRSSTPDYKGFVVSFGAPDVPAKSGPSFGPKGPGSYKAGFQLSGADWQTVTIPRSEFSYDWSPFTGRCDTTDPGDTAVQHYCCSDSDSKPSKDEVCVDDKLLDTVNQVSLWAEGVEGEFELEFESITASIPGAGVVQI